GLEAEGEVGEARRVGVLVQGGGELPAVGDEPADEGEEAGDLRCCVRAGRDTVPREVLRGIRLGGGVGRGGRGGHERMKNTICGRASRKIFIERLRPVPGELRRGVSRRAGLPPACNRLATAIAYGPARAVGSQCENT